MGWGPKGQGWGKKIFSVMRGWDRDGARQNLAWQGQKPRPSDPPCPNAIPTFSSSFFFFLSFFFTNSLQRPFFFSSSFSFFFFLFFFIETSNILYPKKKHTWVPISQTQKIKPINTWFRSDTLTHKHKPTNMFIHTSTKIPLPPIIPIQRPQNKNSLSVKLSQQTMKLKSKTKI